ncbi:uncharacterized protein B0J16DRAFT_348555 [Fusarium flagelliforme]|uniref:CBM-cenC domain-containing protein n=1 Tax=Fusarium flagelliforme TaxID=2675880 RepID=A0A395MEB7_9HYPO|nr:uncharacterized protein B0J16DRAFT_348555 [Fusarium flagelliforme]KAH7174386.1 hypothetical protein B0J16DRAFT_348555 [Fusarium flagelliforme]RFN45603.1 hypothetical protein FIE12Z_10157 [Fusarium flagelliforme]
MRVTTFNLAFAFLALCGNGHAGPCKPKSTSAALDGPSSTEGTTSASTQETISTSTVVSATTEESTAVESLTSSIISEPVSSIVTTTSDALLSLSTELSASSETTETSNSMTAETPATTTMTTELSSEFPTTSNTAETTTSDVPISTTTEEPAPSGLFLNPSFDEPNPDGEFDGSPWIMADGASSSVSINPDLAHTGSHSAYWSITATAEDGGTIKQRVSFESDHLYKLSYWWYIDEDVQPQNSQGCYITIVQEGTDGLTSSYPEFLPLISPLPLKTWTKREFLMNPMSISPADMIFSVFCFQNVGNGLKVAIDDIKLLY